MRNSVVLPPHRHRLLLRPNCPITQELLHNRKHLFLHKYKHQFPASQASYSEHPLPSQQQQQQQPGRFSFAPQFPETSLVRDYYGSHEKQPAQRQECQQEYPGEQQAVYGVKSSLDQHLDSRQGYMGGGNKDIWSRRGLGGARVSIGAHTQLPVPVFAHVTNTLVMPIMP